MELTQRIKQRLREVDDWSTVVDELEAEAGAASDKAEQSKAFFELARACEDVFLDKARAMQSYQKAFKLDQSNLEALRRARQIYATMANLEMVTRLMGLELKANRDEALAGSLHYDFGTAQLNLRNFDDAKQHLGAAAEAEPDNELFQARFQETLYDRSNWELGLETVYAQLTALTGEGDPLAAKVANRGSQLSALYMKAARILQQESPEDDRLLPLLFKALEADPKNEEAGYLADTLLAAAGQLQHVQKLQDRRVELLESDADKVDMLRGFADIWEVRLNNPQMAAYFFHQALDLAYSTGTLGSSEETLWNVAAYRKLVASANESGQADALVPLAERGIGSLRDPAERVLLGLEGGAFAWRAFQDPATAGRFLGLAVDVAPDHPTVVAFQSEVGDLEPVDLDAFGGGAAEAEEAALEPEPEAEAEPDMPEFEPEAEAEPEPEPEAVEDEPEDEAEAEPEPEPEVVEDEAEPETVVEAEPEAEPEPEPEAEPEEDEPEEDEPEEDEPEREPVSLGDESFDADEMALIEKAQAADKKGGKRAIDAWRDAVSKMPDKVYPRERLKQLYVDNNKWSNVADLLKDQIKRTPDEDLDTNAALHWELVELYRERLRQPGLVVTTLGGLEKLLEAAGENERLLKVVEEQQNQFESMKRWPDLIGRIRRRAELVEDMQARKELHLQAGALFLEKFNNQAEAIKSYEAVLECDEYDPTAISKLKELYQRRRDWEKMLSVQQKELALIEDPEERKAQLLEVARVAGQKIKKPAISIELWSQVLESDPDNVEALENLESMQEREKDWDALSKTLERLIEVTVDDTKKTQYLVKLGLLYADKVNDNPAAIRTWEALHEIDSDNRRAQDQLKKLYIAEGDMNALEQFYAKQDKWAEFIRVLEREVDGADDERKIELQLKIAALYRDKIEKPERAVRTLEKALADGDNLTVAEKLIELYEDAGDERHLARPLQIKLDNEEDPQTRQALLRRLADLAERIAHEPEQAFAFYQKALEEDHTATDAREHLERLAETTNQWQPLAQSLELAIKEFGESTDSLPLRLKLAEINEQHMADLDAALAVNQAIVEIDPEQPTALASLERLYLALGREEDLLAVLDTKLSLSNDEEERRATQTRIGSIHEQLGHHDKAIEAYNAVLDSGVEDPEVLAALDRIYSNLERWEDLGGILERELAVAANQDADAATRAEYLLRLGVIMQDRLDKPEEAVELYRQVLEIDPANDSARDRLEGWLEEGEESSERAALRVKVAGILLPIYEAMEAHAEQVQCLEIQADAAEDKQDRVDLLLRIGELLAHSMGDSTRAFDVYARAFREQPENQVASQSLENIATVEDRWQDFADLHEEAVSKDLESGLMRRLLTRLATLYDQQLGDAEKSIACYQRAVEIDPGDSSSLDALEALYSRDQNWEQLLEVYRSKVELESDPQMREDLRFKIAHLQVDMLGRPADGIVTYNEILADDDVNTRAITALDRLYLEAEQWPELAENLSRQLALTADPTEQIELNLRLGSLQLTKLSQPALAVETYHRVLEFDPVNESALEALETLLGDEDHQLSVAKILEPIYKASNDWNKLVGAYEIMVKHSLEPSEKIQLLHQIGELFELAGDEPEKAFDAYGRALKEDPSRDDTQTRLDNLANQMGAFSEMVGLYEGVVDDVVDDQLRLAILGKVARTYETAIDDAENAAATYEKMLAVDPANFEAVDALIEVHRRTNNFEPLVAAVVRKAEMIEAPEDQKRMLAYAASIREGVMEDSEGAIELYQRVLTIDDADREALDALERLYVGLERWEPLRDIYQRKSELAEDPDERRQALYVLGQVYDAELKDIDRAIDTYQAVLDIEPGDPHAIQALDRLYGQAERWLDQMQILERAVDAFETAEEQTALRYRVGQLWENQLADAVRGIEAYREVLVHDPTHEPTIEALQRIVHGENEPMAAAQVLAPLYEQFSEWEKLVEIYEVMVTHTEDPVGKIERLHQVAGIYELQLSEFDKAFDAYARALATDPQHEVTVEQLERLAEVTGDWEKFAELLAEQAEKLLDPNAKTQMLSRLARIQEERLGDVEESIGRYLEVLHNDPEDAEAIAALDRIFTATERWPELVENLRRQISITGDEQDLIAHYFRMGQVYQIQMEQPARAIEAYREILNIDPAHEQTLQALEVIFTSGEHQSEIAEILEPIYQAAERWEALVKLGSVKLGATDDPHERLSIFRDVAEICEHRLGSLTDACSWWLSAYLDAPASEEVHEELDRLAEMTDAWEYVVEAGQKILSEEQSPEVKQVVTMRSARVLDSKLQDGGRAIDAYRAVLELDAENQEALAALDRIYSQLGMAQDLAEILQRRIRITMDGEALVDLEVRLAETFERDLHNHEQAIAAYNRALENDPSNTTSLERLETLYLYQHKWEELFDVYQKTVDVANTDENTADCYQRMAKIASDALDREPDAIDLWNKVLDLRGEDPLALGELAALHEKNERWDDLVEILERQVFVIEDAQRRVDAYQTLGRVYGQRLERERNALDAWLNALDLDPNNLETLQALHRIYEDSQAWVELIQVLESLIAQGPEVIGHEELKELHAKSGRIHGEYLMQPDQAIESWHSVLHMEPGNMEALAALEALYTQEARWNDAIDILEQKTKVLDGDEKIDVLMQIASIWEERLEDKHQAAGAYQEILENDLAHGPAGEALEQIYRDTEDYASLGELLFNRAEVLTDVDSRVTVLQNAANVFEEHLGDADLAFETLQLAFKSDYSNDLTARELERLATEHGKWTELLNEYNELVQQIEDPMERCELWVKIGRWYGEHLNHAEYGIQSLEKALELNPESVSALRELSNFQKRSESWHELAQTQERLVQQEPEPERQTAVLLELAEVQEQRLGNVPGSVESYRRVLEIDSESTTALDALIRLHEQQQSWSELVGVLDRRAAIADDPDEGLRLRKHIGYVQEANLGDNAAAVETYKDILAQEPTDFDALQALERLYLNGNQIPEYLEILEAELDATADVDTQVGIYDKMANALVSLSGDRERAAEVLEKIIMLDPQRDVTYRQLEELYTGLEKWTELVETYRSHIQSTDDPTSQIELLTAMGEVFEKQVEDVDRAIETYEEILEIDPTNFDAANTLSRLQEAMEDWPRAVETMGRLVELTPDPNRRIELLTRIGRVQHEKLMNSDEAEMRLNQALTVEPGHVPALILLADIYKQRADWLKASRTLEAAAEYSQNTLERTNLAAEAAFINYEELENREHAVELFAKTLHNDPEHVRVGSVLAEVYVEEENWQAADPVLDMLTRKVDQQELDDDGQKALFLQAARVARRLGNIDKALKQYKRAYDIDSTDHEVLVGMADLLFEKEDWDRSFKLYQTILVQHRDTQADEDTVRVYHRLGTIKNRQSEPRKALNYFEKALEVDPHHNETLVSVINLRAQANDWEGVIEAKRALVDITPDGDAQFGLWKDIGELYAEKLGNRDKSAAAYQSALDLRPEDYPTLHTLLDLYTNAKRWEDAISVIDRLVEIETDVRRRSRYNYTAAVLLRDELGAPAEAIDRFNQVLDDDPSMLKAFQAIDTMLTKDREWKTLERSYRKMLKRLPQEGNEPLKVTLWSNLAEIYRSRMQDFKSAAAAFEVAAKLDPDDVTRHIKLAELYERLMVDSPTEYVDSAVREHQILIASEPFRYESYHALFNIYVKASAVDKAFCVASVLSFLKKATAEEEAYVEQHKRGDFVMARQRLSEETLRRHVFHPDQDLYLTGILGLIAPAVAAWRAVDLPATLNPNEVIDIEIDPSLFSRMAKYTKDVLNVSKPDVFLRPSDPGDLKLMNFKRNNAIHPSMVVFQNLLRGKSEAHLAFALGRHMMDLYLPHFCYVALDRTPQNLKQVFLACLRAVGMPVGDNNAALDQIAREITSRMQPAALDRLRSLIQKFVDAGGSTDVKRWAAAVELTSYRVGLLLCHDLRIAGQMISQEQAMLGSAMGPRDKIKELVLYSISEDYFAARRAIGVQVS